MKRFAFNLQALLTVREWEAQRAQQRLGEANLRIAQLERQIQDALGSKGQAFEEWSAATRTGFTAQDRINLNARMAGMERQVAELRQRLQQAQQQRQSAMEGVKAAMRGKKVVENLKERRLEEHSAAIYRQELAEIEDLFNARRSAS